MTRYWAAFFNQAEEGNWTYDGATNIEYGFYDLPDDCDVHEFMYEESLRMYKRVVWAVAGGHNPHYTWKEPLDPEAVLW